MPQPKKPLAKSAKPVAKKSASKPGNKKPFPDRNGDGKITKMDILIAKGVIPMKKK
jgi:hypothetical protein